VAVTRRIDIRCAQIMYAVRLRELHEQVRKLVEYAVLDESYEEEALGILEELEREINGIGDCISVLEHLSSRIEDT
jgi:hypothetical protein